jgi:hypothetical protein
VDTQVVGEICVWFRYVDFDLHDISVDLEEFR